MSATAVDPTQVERILAVLTQRHGQWVPMPELARESGAYAVHSRISDLRKDGWVIETKIERVRGRRTQASYYRLLTPVPRQEVLPL